MSYAGLCMYQNASILKFTSLEENKDQCQILDIDLENKKINIGKEKSEKTEYIAIPGILGVFSFSRHLAVIIITACKKVASYHGHPIFKIIKTDIIVPKNTKMSDQDLKYWSLLKKAVDSEEVGRGLYFCYNTNLTLHTERLIITKSIQKDGTDVIQHDFEDNRFFWNKYLTSSITESKAYKFVLPVIQGYISEISKLEFNKENKTYLATLTIIARRSVERIGTRHWRRGIDRQGSASNFVETEQIVYFPHDKSVCSFIQLRGSVPLLWSQIPNIKYKPPTDMPHQDIQSSAFDKHMYQLIETYKECVAVNLVNQHGSEGRLYKTFEKESERFSNIKEGFKLVSFDFHKECGTKSYHNLSKLMDSIDEDYKKFKYFSTEKDEIKQRQLGIFRTNCIDCLDRTNVVQGLLARRILEDFLISQDYLKTNTKIENIYPKVDKLFKEIWADHGDEISNQYAGTGALKSGFTRTGKRTISGLIDDGIKSCIRYYLNNFQDGFKQDALDLVTGVFLQDSRVQGFIGTRRSPQIAISTAMILLFIAIIQILKFEKMNISVIMLSMTGFIILVALIIKYGKYLVCKPGLRPDLIKQW